MTLFMSLLFAGIYWTISFSRITLYDAMAGAAGNVRFDGVLASNSHDLFYLHDS